MPMAENIGGVPLGCAGLQNAPGIGLFIVVTGFHSVLIRLKCPPYAYSRSCHIPGLAGVIPVPGHEVNGYR